MAKLTLSNLTNLQNEASAVATLAANNTATINALENTLSRDGTSPNVMLADLDMNSHNISNLPDPVSSTEPVTLGYADTHYGDSLAYAVDAAASAVAAANSAVNSAASSNSSQTYATASAASATTASTQATNAATSASAASTSATAAATSATQAANSVSAIKWNFESSTSMGNPASGGFRFNNATPASVTAIALSATDADGNSASAVVNTWDDSTTTAHRGVLKVRKLSSATTYALYDLTAAITDNTSWLQLTLTYISGSGTFSATDACDMTFVRTGDAGSGTISGLSAHGVGIAGGATSITASVALTDGQLLVGQTGADPQAKTITGDVTFTAAGASAIKTSVSLTTPVLGVATATSINKMAVTAPATSSTLAVADGKTLTASNTLTLAGTDSTTMTFPGVSSNVGYLEIPQNSKSAAYTTVLSDSGKHIYHPSSDNNARTFTIDSNANVAYPIGTFLVFVNEINTVTISITSDTLTLQGANSTGSRTLAAGGCATALKVASTKWIISGAGLS